MQGSSVLSQKDNKSAKQKSKSLSSLYLFENFALFLGKKIPSNICPHSHHLLKIFISMGHSFSFEHAGKWRKIDAAIIGPDEVHRFESNEEGDYAVLYLEGDSMQARHLLKECIGKYGICILSSSVFIPVKTKLGELLQGDRLIDDASLVSQEILNIIFESYTQKIIGFNTEIDPRVNKAIDFIKDSFDKKTKINMVTQEVGLSESRLIHLFTHEVGVPPRRYSLWLRLLDAINEIVQGASFTEAAYSAGFSDSAHLSRTFRQMFGLSLIDVFKNTNVNIASSYKQD